MKRKISSQVRLGLNVDRSDPRVNNDTDKVRAKTATVNVGDGGVEIRSNDITHQSNADRGGCYGGGYMKLFRDHWQREPNIDDIEESKEIARPDDP